MGEQDKRTEKIVRNTVRSLAALYPNDCVQLEDMHQLNNEEINYFVNKCADYQLVDKFSLLFQLIQWYELDATNSKVIKSNDKLLKTMNKVIKENGASQVIFQLHETSSTMEVTPIEYTKLIKMFGWD